MPLKQHSRKFIDKLLEYAALLGRRKYLDIQKSLEEWLFSLPDEQRPMESVPDARTIRRFIEVEFQQYSQEAVIEQLPTVSGAFAMTTMNC